MSLSQTHLTGEFQAVVGEPEVVEDTLATNGRVEDTAAWLALKDAAIALQGIQAQDGSVPDAADHADARTHAPTIIASIRALSPWFPHDAEYLAASARDFERWADGGFGVPDFYDSLVAFQPQLHRVDGIRHLVVFPMYTQNGSSNRYVEALIVEVIWPEFIAELEHEYTNRLFVSLRLIDFTPGYDTNSAVLFPETVAMREIPTFTWGAIFQDREAARYRRVVRAAAEITKLDLPDGSGADAGRPGSGREDVRDVGPHPRPHPHARRPAVRPVHDQAADAVLPLLARGAALRPDRVPRVRRDPEAAARASGRRRGADRRRGARCSSTRVLVQYAVIFDRIFRFAITGTRVRNYDAVGGQLLFAWLHQRGVLHWTDTALAFDWDEVPAAVVALGDAIDELYWRSIDRPKTAHWLAAYELVRATLTPNPASRWARGLPEDVLAGAPKGYTDEVLDDEFPLSMFFEALEKKMRPVIASTAGIRAADD